MNSEYYNNATLAYNSGDYVKALEGFYNCLTKDADSFDLGDTGLIYHRLGNCMVKVDRYEEAVAVYRKSLEDEHYSERGSIFVNLGTALTALGRSEEAVVEFRAALDDEGYSAPYRAWMGMGNALSKLGRIVEAGTAYRTAALDPNNPSPVKALMNLGASFSALDRPGDAVEAYLAILEFRVTGTTLNRTYERLGGAYFANGQYAEAAQAFYDAMLGGGYELTERSQAQLAQAKLALSTGFTPVVRTQTNLSASGAMAAVNAAAASAAAGSDAASDYSAQLEDSSSLQAIDHEDGRNLAYGTDQSAETEVDFFTATDEELIEVSKRQARKERKQRHVGLKVFLAILIVIVLAFGAAIVAFTQGYGWPTQQATINSFFDSHASGSEVSPYWISTALDDPVAFNRILQSVAEVDSSAVTIIAIDRYISESEALIGVRLPEGGMIHYRVTLVRDGIGWKISRIELAFASQE